LILSCTACSWLIAGSGGSRWWQDCKLEKVDTLTFTYAQHRSPQGRHCRPPDRPRSRPQLDMHRQSIASRSQFGQSSAQTATTQALRNKKREYEAISALEQSCAELIATLEDMATDLNTNAEATIGTISSSVCRSS